MSGAIRTLSVMTETLIGYARCSTDDQDLTAQRERLRELGVADKRIYLDHGLTGTTRARPGLDQALAAVRAGDTLVVPKLDRLAPSVPDARAIADALVARGVKLALGSSVYDPADPMGKMFFNILATFAEFEADLIRLRTREGMAVARARGKLKGKQQAVRPAAEGAAPHARHRRLLDQRFGRAVLGVPPDGVPHPRPASAGHNAEGTPPLIAEGQIGEGAERGVRQSGVFRYTVTGSKAVISRSGVQQSLKDPLQWG